VLKIKCSKCGWFKEYHLFYNDKNRKNGKQGHCKLCNRRWQTAEKWADAMIKRYDIT